MQHEKCQERKATERRLLIQIRMKQKKCSAVAGDRQHMSRSDQEVKTAKSMPERETYAWSRLSHKLCSYYQSTCYSAFLMHATIDIVNIL